MLPLIKALTATKDYFRTTYLVAKPYWTSEHKVTAWGLLLLVLATTFGKIYLFGKISYVSRDMLDALDKRNFDLFWEQMWVWFGFFTIVITAYLTEVHAQYHLVIKWREFLTDRHKNNYLNSGIFNQMELKDYNVDNPDQRISQDMFNVASETLELGISALTALGTLGLFGYILFVESGPLEFDIGSFHVFIPGYMFWVAIIYALTNIWLVHKFGKRLMPLNFEKQQREADFRFHLVRIRENSESVALLKGEEGERNKLTHEFNSIKQNWFEILKYKKRLLAVNMGMNQLSHLFPYLVAMPALMAGTIALGGLMQLRSAFAQLETSLVWFAIKYETIAIWKSSMDRIISLETGIEAAEKERRESRLVIENNDDNELRAEKLLLDLPTGERLINSLDFTLKAGQHMVVTGASGGGKSTLFRALAGVWVWGEGIISHPRRNLMFIPQKPYLPQGSLKDVLLYPHNSNHISDDEIIRVMKLCSLDKFSLQLDDEEDWSKIFSGGEQQRISFVRALLCKPDWLFLDESTSALDPKTEGQIYKAIQQEMPNTTIVSIAHRESLKQYHSHELHIDGTTKTFSFNSLSV